jgi:4-amino-4-deoxy-L-arabinose transferase-like glycosyltransferase
MLGSILFFAIGVASPGLSIPNAENWQDYAYAYLTSAHAFTGGHLPYIDFYFAYPPLFLYALAAFSYLGPAWAAALPSVIAEALTAVPVYLIAKRYINERAAFIASLVLVLAPMNLYYADYLWLNPPLTTLFLLVTVYFFIEGRYDLSAVTLALSIGFKQTALLALPVLLIFLWKKTSSRRTLRYLLVVSAICLVFSVPYLFLSPGLYLFSIFRLPLSSFSLPQNYYQLIAPTGPVQTINTATLTGYFHSWSNLTDVNGPVSLILPLFVLLASGAQQAFANANLGLTGITVVAYLVLLYRAYRKKSVEDEAVVLYVLSSLLVLFTFDSLYKYYFVGVAPLVVLAGPTRRGMLAFLGLNAVLLLIPRIVASYVPLALLVWLTWTAFRSPSGKGQRDLASKQEPPQPAIG